jgi:hypothetical protein
MVVAKKKPSALDALAKLDEERTALAAREVALKREAALELGTVVLAGGGAIVRPDRLKQIVERIIGVGPDEALRRLSNPRDERRSKPREATGGALSGEGHHAAEPCD